LGSFIAYLRRSAAREASGRKITTLVAFVDGA